MNGNERPLGGKERFIIGGIAALLPIIVTVLSLDIGMIMRQGIDLKPEVAIGIGIRYVALFLIGGFMAYLHDDEKTRYKLFEIGLAAPALISTVIASQGIGVTPTTPNPAEDNARTVISFVSSAYAAGNDATSPFGHEFPTGTLEPEALSISQGPLVVAGGWGNIVKGVTGRVYKDARQEVFIKKHEDLVKKTTEAELRAARAEQRAKEIEERYGLLNKSRDLAAERRWADAIDAYTSYLRMVPVSDSRDHKLYSWILREYENASESAKTNYALLQRIALGKLPKPKQAVDPIMTWRLYHLLALIEVKKKNDGELRKQMEKAIAAYPNEAYTNFASQSGLGGLYNEIALSQAKADPGAGEDYLFGRFLSDDRFVHVPSSPWKDFYKSRDMPKRYTAFLNRLISAYREKATRTPQRAKELQQYQSSVQRELNQPSNEKAEPRNPVK